MIEIDLQVKHHFSDSVYAKEMRLPKGHYAVSHKHNYDHLSVLASGKALVSVGDQRTIFDAPSCINIGAGVEHRIDALEDIVWYCIHATDEKDVAKIDEVLIERG
jgi:quercetin dioxygenase-like cupin family protein